MKIGDIVNALEAFAPTVLQEDYDNCGLITGNRNQPVSKALLCLDSTEEVIAEAEQLGCEMVIAHHPIIFRGLKKLNGKNYVERAVIRAIRSNIAVYACHTNLDNVADGVNRMIAERLGLQNCRVLQPKDSLLLKLVVFVPIEHTENVLNAMFEAGAGEIGNYAECSFQLQGSGTFKAGEGAKPFAGTAGKRHHEAENRVEVILPDYRQQAVLSAMLATHPYEEVAYDLYRLENTWNQVGSGLIGELEAEMDETQFLHHLKSSMELPLVRHSGAAKKIKTVAVCGGSGSFLTQRAISAGADVYVTADIKYHEFFDAEDRLLLCDIGHYESEKYTMNLFAEILSQKFPNFATIFAKTLTNPVKYF